MSHVCNYALLTRLLLIFLIQVPLYDASCAPSPTELSPGFSVVELGETKDFCVANHRCRQFGNQHNSHVILIGRNYVQLPAECYDSNAFLWTSINDLLVDCGLSRVGWRDADPRDPLFTSAKDSFEWHDEQPQGEEHVGVVRGSSKTLHDILLLPQFTKLYVICEVIWVNPIRQPILSRNLFHARFPTPLTDLFSRNKKTDSCHEMHSFTTAIRCTLKCSLEPYCRSIYFQHDTSNCVLMMFVDAKIPSRFADIRGQWTRYGKATVGQRGLVTDDQQL